jgi:hypothetical protein
MPDVSGPRVSGTTTTQDAGQNPLSNYFANKPVDELMASMKVREKNAWNARQSRGLPNLWRLIYAQAFGMDPASGRNATQKLEFIGAQANYCRFRVNLTRSHVKQRNQIAQGQRPSFSCVASNDDAASLAQIPIAGKVITYVFRESNGEQALYEALESDGYFGEGHLWARWDTDAGDTEKITVQVPAVDQFTKQPMTDPQTGQPITRPDIKSKRVGAPTFTALFPWNAITEPNTRVPSWILTREKTSKYELMARFPEKAVELERLTLTRDNEPGMIELFQWDVQGSTDDVVAVKHFYHKNCTAVPGGRYVGYVNDVMLWDVPCPVSDGLPFATICSARYFDTNMGYPESSDLLSLQEMIDELLSQGATNILKFGNQNIWGEDGVEFDPQAFMEGGKYFTLKTGQKPPQVIQWAELPGAVQYLLEYLPQRMAEISGMNSVVRGEPDSNITSGVFASLMQSIAEKFVNSTQASYDAAVNSIGNITLELVRNNTDTRFAAQVSGEANIPYMKYFTASDFASIKRVLVQRQSPVFNSIGGRFEVFDKTVRLPPAQRRAAIQMLETGDSSAWMEDDTSCLILIRKENELLARGIPCTVSKTDDYREHVPKHRASLDRLRTQDQPQQGTPEFQQWNAAVQAHIKHISDHALTSAQTEPIFAQVCGLPPPPMPQMAPDGSMRLGPHPGVPISPPQSQGAPGGPPAGPPPKPGNAGPPQLPPGAANPQSAAGRQPQGAPASNPGLPKSPNQQPGQQGPAA